jgi:membrane protease YdiL (CAAX protease family)
MSTNGSSARNQLPFFVAPLAVLVGVAAMPLAAGLVASFGIRPTLLLAELALVAPGLICLALFAVPPRTGLALYALDGRRVAISLAAGVSLWAASLGLLEVQYALWQPPSGYLETFRRIHEALRPHGFLDALLSLGAIALAPAVCEELLFRGIVLPSLLRPLGPAAAVILSSLLFGVIHLDTTGSGVSLYRVPFAIVVGVGLGALRVRTGSLVSPILAHALLNAITFAVVPFADDEGLGAAAPNPLLGAGLLLFGSAITIWLVWRAGIAPRRWAVEP